MNFTVTDRNLLIADMQCKQATLAEELDMALSIGNCPDNLNMANAVAMSLIKIFYRYKAFDSEIYYAASVEFGSNDTAESVSVLLYIDGALITTYTGTGDGNDIASYLAAYINSHSTVYQAIYSGATLYIYSYDPTTSFSFATTCTVRNITADINTMDEDDLNDILYLWNCITLEQLSSIRCFFHKVITSKCNC